MLVDERREANIDDAVTTYVRAVSHFSFRTTARGNAQSRKHRSPDHINFITDSVDFDARLFRNGLVFDSVDSLRPLHGTGNHPELPCTFSYPSSPPRNENDLRVNFMLMCSLELFSQRTVISSCSS